MPDDVAADLGEIIATCRIARPVARERSLRRGPPGSLVSSDGPSGPAMARSLTPSLTCERLRVRLGATYGAGSTASNHRVTTSDVIEFRRARLARQRAAFHELAALEDELEDL
ncbi:hypothetical protein [Xylanimonas cellulosilytica]|uniref:hypothetical protein n=1 Tax=Xylanimonas cellulosilytica TaxID=186189 RepID=UPI00019C0F38|nr:hypothetical protein [Xylanimonas cellulosilytica]